MAKIGSLTADLRLESAAFIRDLRNAANATARNTQAMTRSVNKMQAGFAKASSAIKGAVAGYFSIQSVRMVANFARNALNAAAAIKETADALGIGASKLQAYQIAGEQVGISNEAMEKSLGIFVRVVGQAKEGLGPLQSGLKETNATLLESLKGATSTAEAVDLMLDAIKEAPTIFEKQRLAALAFGRGSKEMALLAAESTREARQAFIDMGLTVDDALGGKLDKIMDDFALMQRAVQAGFATGFIKTFNENLSGTDGQLKSISEASEKFGSLAAQALTTAGDALKWAAENADLLKGAVGLLIAYKLAAWASAGAAAVTGLAAAFGGASAAVNTFKTAMAGLGPIGLLIAAMIDVEQRSQALVESSERVRAANEANANSLSAVGSAAGIATTQLFAYTGALNSIPNGGGMSPTSANDLFSQMGGIPGQGEAANPFKAASDGIAAVGAAAADATPKINAVNASLAAGGQQAATMGAMHEMTANQITMGWLNVAETVGGALQTLFGENKAVAIGMAVINTAQAITAALAQYPPPLSFAMAAAQAAAGAAQIAAIASARPGSRKAPSVRGGGGGGGSSSVSQAGEASRIGGLKQAVTINITGESFGPEHFKRMIDGLNGVLADGAVLRMG